MLRPVRKRAVSEEVFEQLRDAIVRGGYAAGAPLPAERELCEAFGVNRGSVREALRRLQQARLVSVRHGGTSQVLDFRHSGGLDLLPELLLSAGPGGAPDARLVASVLEMRSALGADAARLAAERGGAEAAARLARTVEAMRGAGGDAARLQDLAAGFWEQIVEASGNLAYRLANNSLRQVYDLCRPLLVTVLGDEIGDVDAHAALADAVKRRRAAEAERLARALLRRGEENVKRALGRTGRAPRRTP